VKRAREAAKDIVEEGVHPEDISGGFGASPPKDSSTGGSQV